VEGGDSFSRQQALDIYLQSIDYAFRGATNEATGDIKGCFVGKKLLGWVYKNSNVLSWGLGVEPKYVVIYDVTTDVIFEKLYISDGLDVGVSESNLKPVWFKGVVEGDSDTIKKNTLSAVAAIDPHVTGYGLVWNNEKRALEIKKRGRDSTKFSDTESVLLEDIDSDELYTLFTLVNLIIPKGKHVGVFFINCRGFSKPVLDSLIKLVEGVYGDAFVYLYNCNHLRGIRRDVVKLPNFLTKEGVSG